MSLDLEFTGACNTWPFSTTDSVKARFRPEASALGFRQDHKILYLLHIYVYRIFILVVSVLTTVLKVPQQNHLN